MGRKPAVVIKSVLSECVQQIKNYTDKQDFFNQLSKLYAEKTNKVYSTSTLRNKMLELNVEAFAVTKAKKSTKVFSVSDNDLLIIKFLKESLPDKYKHLCDKIQNYGISSVKGMKLLTKIKCLQCVNYNTREITECTVSDCALYLIRPFQNAKHQN